jgi:peptidoglycan/LPS O-acetylase OafA/YrhL
MLPVARKGHGRLLGGFRNYLYRRARRILPPYYAALGASLGLIVLHNAVGTSHGGEPIEAALKPGSIVSHILLLHNLNFDWAYRINGPMWSVATEWQIYFVFPALLLPLWRHAGALTTAGVAWVAGSIPFFVLPSQSNFYWACPWFVGSFALGMAGATIGFSPGYQGSWLRDRAPWGALASATLVVLGAMIATGLDARIGYPVIDLIVSVLAFCLINACSQHFRSQATGLQGLFARILSSRALVYIGGFSYSLYLMQHPVLRLTERVLGRIPVGYDAQIAIYSRSSSSGHSRPAGCFCRPFNDACGAQPRRRSLRSGKGKTPPRAPPGLTRRLDDRSGRARFATPSSFVAHVRRYCWFTEGICPETHL